MSLDIFSRDHAKNLLILKRILFFGSSNMRALYKDLVWLLENETLIPESSLRSKNEDSFANDVKVSNSRLMNSRNYKEDREYNNEVFLRFQFITRLYLQEFTSYLSSLETPPDVIIINSCLWDLTRWGPNGVEEYKANVDKTFKFLREKFGESLRIIWLTSLPPSNTGKGLLTKKNEFMRSLLPFHILEANNYSASIARSYHIDVLDLHYHMRSITYERCKDGIHWTPLGVRYLTNLLLTHLSLVLEQKLPNREDLNVRFLEYSEEIFVPNTSTKNKMISEWPKVKTGVKRPNKKKKKNSYNSKNQNYHGQNFEGRYYGNRYYNDPYYFERNLEDRVYNYLYYNYYNNQYYDKQNYTDRFYRNRNYNYT